MAAPSALFIDRGDLPSLVALAIEPRPHLVGLVHPRQAGAAARRREAIVAQHEAAFGTGRPLMLDPIAHSPDDPADPVAEALVLLLAGAEAARLGCRRIIWPRQVGLDPEAVGHAVERAHLVEDLLRVGASGPDGPVVDLPVVDLTEAQVADLADDTGAPLSAFWPCAEGTASPCGRCDGCRRWRVAFDDAGVAWPWAAVGQAVRSG